jgi:large subunit ribosomal protein L4
MDYKITAANGKASKSNVSLADNVFAREFNETLVHQVVVAHMAGGRAGTRAHKSRSEVRGGGAKPWRQKGTGRARAGTIRSPIWRSGGKTFASKPQDYSQKVNKKMRRAAMQAILSELARQDRLVLVDDFGLEAPKTKQLVTKLNEMGLGMNCLVVTEAFDQNLHLSGRNLADVDVKEVAKADPVSLVKYEKVLMTVGAAKKFEEMLA